jgi:hypothetical protein
MFRATQDPSNGEIAVVRIPALDEIENAFIFRDMWEMRDILLSRHARADVELLVKVLTAYGLAHFSVEYKRAVLISPQEIARTASC